MKTIKFKQQMKFQSFKIIQDFKKDYTRRFCFFCFFFLFFFCCCCFFFVCVCVCVLEFYGPVNNEVMSSRSVNSGTVPGSKRLTSTKR